MNDFLVAVYDLRWPLTAIGLMAAGALFAERRANRG